MRLKKLLSYIESLESPEDSFVRLDSISFKDNDGILGMSIWSDYEQEAWSHWEVRAKALRSYRITESYGDGDLALHKGDHVLTLQHTEARQELYFRGSPQSAPETIGRLLIAHREIAGNWIPFEQFFNSYSNLDLLAGGFGLLAEGPTFLIEAYARVLSSEGLKPNTLASRPACWWNGQKWIENTVPLAALVIGNSFFVAEDFKERQFTGRTG
ncbi:MAG: hypothetical protein K8S55_12880 [Phycisphaerae bacterium]|nr:hypothetical protein [Phycisphaerae bacterium]